MHKHQFQRCPRNGDRVKANLNGTVRSATANYRGKVIRPTEFQSLVSPETAQVNTPGA